ncbi:hypothetical protein G4B84_000885 [Aspergillus flavus NRRL3357]|nr:uncharacterized protein G4B84_000885 [Aspergillus flavus NRRL3357]QMW25640.1 hypothetical protein G4B84_000885 [Aspergillus flavus NRRL3357]
MKIQHLLSLIALGFTLGEPIPKQALSQRQADDNSSGPKLCETWAEQMKDLQAQRVQAIQDYRSDPRVVPQYPVGENIPPNIKTGGDLIVPYSILLCCLVSKDLESPKALSWTVQTDTAKHHWDGPVNKEKESSSPGARDGHYRVVTLLLAEGGFDLKAKDVFSETPLSLAAKDDHGQGHVMKTLLAVNDLLSRHNLHSVIVPAGSSVLIWNCNVLQDVLGSILVCDVVLPQ